MTVYAEELQARWRAVARHFRAWSMPIDIFVDPTSYKLWGADLLPGVLQNRRARAAAADLQGATPEALEALSTMAQINVQRSGDVFKAVAICYITLPLAFLALASDAAPDQLREAINANVGQIAYFVLALIISPIVYFLGHWRAKQMAWTIDLYRAGALVTLPKRKRG